MTDTEGDKPAASIEDGLELPPRKRKKTVTWAGDVPKLGADMGDEQSASPRLSDGPPVVVVEQDGESLFVGLDAEVERQEEVAVSFLELHTEALMQRRADAIDQLYQHYEEEMWSLYGELQLRHSHFKKHQQQPAFSKPQLMSPETPGLPHTSVALPSAGGELPSPVDEEETVLKMVTGIGKPVSLRQLFYQRAMHQELKPGAHQPTGAEAEGAGTDTGDSAVLKTQQAHELHRESTPAQAQQHGRGGSAETRGTAHEQPVQDGPGCTIQCVAAETTQAVGSRAQGSHQQGGPEQAGLYPVELPPQLQQPPNTDECVAGEAKQRGVPLCREDATGVGGRDGNKDSGESFFAGRLSTAAPLPLYEDVEELIVGSGAACGPPSPSTLCRQRANFLHHLDLIGRLEQSMLGMLCQDLDRYDALAALCGRRQRYLVRRTAVVVGRNTHAQNKVDVDLSAEVNSQTVSRLQAQLILEPVGKFYLRCLGRRKLVVNGKQVSQGDVAALPHLSLIKAGGVSLLFFENRTALQRLLKRSTAVAV